MHGLFDAIGEAYRSRRGGGGGAALVPMLRRLRLPGAEPPTAQPRPLLYATPDGALRCASARENESTERGASAPAVRSSSSSVARAAVEDGLMGILINILSGSAEGGECAEEEKKKEGLFTLEERVEALHTVVYLVHSTDKNGGVRGGGEGADEGILGIICKIDLLRISQTACDLLGQVVVRMTAKNSELEGEEERERVLQAFVTVASAVTLLLGCREPLHWRNDKGRNGGLKNSKCNHSSGNSGNENNNNDDDDDYDKECVSGAWTRRFLMHPMERERGSCLCCGTNAVLYQFMMTALTEHSLWQQLWRRVALPFLACNFDTAVNAETSNQSEDSGDGTDENDSVYSVIGARADANDARNVRLTLGVRLTLKMMTLLLLRCPSVGPDLSTILCTLTPSEEAELDSAWHTYASDRAAFTVMERRIVYTLRRLSVFLLFRRVACYAANAMHVFLVRLLTLPAPVDVDVRVVLEGFLFMPDISSSSSSSSAPPVFACVVHAIAFRVSLLRGDDRMGTERNVSAELVVPAALLSALLLLLLRTGKHHFMDRVKDTFFAPLRAMCVCEEQKELQAALTAGLARTHQVMLLLRAVASIDAKNTQDHEVPLTLHLETPYVTAFSRLVRPSAPASVAMPRKHMVAEAWAETLTVRARITAMIGSRQRKPLASFSCVVTCPARPVFLKDSTRNASQKNDKSTMGFASASPISSSSGVVHVYVKTTSAEEYPHSNSNTNTNHSIMESPTPHTNTTKNTNTYMHDMSYSIPGDVNNGNNSSTHNTRISNTADVLPPMMFGSDPVRFGDSGRAVRVSAASPCRPSRGAVETFFVNRDGTEYSRVADHAPCTGALQRERIEYTASAELIVVAPAAQDEWALSAVVVASGTLRFDELQFSALPPRASLANPRARAAAKNKAIAVCSVHRPILSSAESFAGEPRNTNQRANADVREKESGSADASPSQTDEDIDKELDDLDAYVAALRPAPLLDVALEWRDREAAALRGELEQSRAREAQREKELQEALAQRDELRQCLMDARLEVELCHSDIIAPLRREVTQLRRSLTLRNQEMRASLMLCRKLRKENATFAENICDIKKELESVNTMPLSSGVDVLSLTDESEKVN